MTRSKFRIAFAALVALAIAIYVPNVSLAQNAGPGQPAAGQSYSGGQQDQVSSAPPPVPNEGSQMARRTPQPKGGMAKVIGVDQPDDCLRITSGPGNQYDVIGCANMGDQLQITGVWASNDWA